MSVAPLRERRSTGHRPRSPERRAMVVEIAPRDTGRVTHRPTRRQVWIALILYLAAFWGLVGCAIYDLIVR